MSHILLFHDLPFAVPTLCPLAWLRPGQSGSHRPGRETCGCGKGRGKQNNYMQVLLLMVLEVAVKFPSQDSRPRSSSSWRGRASSAGRECLRVRSAWVTTRWPTGPCSRRTGQSGQLLNLLPRRRKVKYLGFACCFRLCYKCSLSSSVIKKQNKVLLAACRGALREQSLGHVTGPRQWAQAAAEG